MKRVRLEISVGSAERAAAAERGGADRIELCSAQRLGGLTPGGELIRKTRAEVQIPIFSMVRPRAGDFVYSPAEIREMRSSIAEAKALGMDGIVLGLLKPGGEVDVERTEELVREAKPLPVTFHRAFDEVRDPAESLERVVGTGASRILTSGGMPSAAAAGAQLAELVRLSAGRIVILPGAGIHAGNVEALLERTQASEVHAALGSLVAESDGTDVFEREVRRLAERLQALASRPR